jgi:hypothetical protein
MPRAPARIRKRFIEGQTEVLDWMIEETLLHGYPLAVDTWATLATIDEWHVAWDRWRDVILPKCIKHRPGTRPVAMYVTGEIPRRELAINVPSHARWQRIEVRQRNGVSESYWLDVPRPFMEPEHVHLRRLGIVDADELRRHRAWMQKRNPECGTCAIDTYPLEMSLYE